MGLFLTFWCHFGDLLVLCGVPFGPLWVPFGVTLVFLGPTWTSLGTLWGHFGDPWPPLGTLLDDFGIILGRSDC